LVTINEVMAELKNIDQTFLILFFIAIFSVHLTFSTFTYPYPNGRDAWFHILVSRAYYRGENGMVSPIVMKTNLVPYAPLYHLMLVPFVGSLKVALLAQQVFQCLFYPLTLLFFMLLTRKHEGFTTTMLFGMLLVGTYFGYGMAQARPQTLAMTLFPLAFWACLEKKAISFVVLVTVMFYVYSPLALALVLGLLVFKLKQKLLNREVLAIAILVAPLLFFQCYHMMSGNIYNRWLRVGDTGILTETQDFVLNPLFFLWTGLGVSMVGFGLIVKKFFNYRKLADFDKLMVLSFLGFLVMAPIWYARVFQVVIVPLAFFTAKFVGGHNRYVKLFFVALIIWQTVVFSFWSFWMSPPPYLWKYW